MGVKTKRYDYGAARLQKQLQKFNKGPFVKAGFPKHNKDTTSKHSDTAATILEIALYHEFGTTKHPERSFVRAAYKTNVKDYRRRNKLQIKKLVRGKTTLKRILNYFGLRISSDIKKYISQKKVRPVSPRATKQSGTTLWDTGQLINSISWVESVNGRNIRRGGKP